MRAPLMQWDPVRPSSLVLQREGVELLRGLKKGVPVVAATMTGAMRSVRSRPCSTPSNVHCNMALRLVYPSARARQRVCPVSSGGHSASFRISSRSRKFRFS